MSYLDSLEKIRHKFSRAYFIAREISKKKASLSETRQAFEKNISCSFLTGKKSFVYLKIQLTQTTKRFMRAIDFKAMATTRVLGKPDQSP